MKTGKFLLLPKDLQIGKKIGNYLEIKRKIEWRIEIAFSRKVDCSLN
jgi:hypothetical protein